MSGDSYLSDDDYSRYSDDFVSDDDVVSVKQQTNTKVKTSKKSNPYTVPNARGRRGRGRGKISQNSKMETPRPLDSSVAKRMMSAHRIRQNEYRNQLEEQRNQIQQLISENKTLKKMQFRHEKALGKFEEKESELPQLLNKHNNEVRALREQNRRMKEKFEKTDRFLRDAEDDLDACKVKLKKYKKLCDSKDLPERDELNRKFRQAEIDLEEKDSRIKELERHIEKLQKNHKHELGIEMAHHRETKRQLKILEEKQNNVQELLREKEKELEIRNIYSNRIIRAPHKLPASYNGTPHHTPPPTRKKRHPSLTDLTARDKAKLYEAKRREEEKQKLESPRRVKKSKEGWKTEEDRVSASDSISNIHFSSYEHAKKEDSWMERERQRQQEETERENRVRLEKVKREQMEADRREQLKKEQEERKRLDEEMKQERERMKRESEEIKRIEAERERSLQEEEERRKRTEQEFERREREERERKIAEEKMRQEAEQEKFARIERERLENDPLVLAERRKKDALLAKMKQIDNDNAREASPVFGAASKSTNQHANFIGSFHEDSNVNSENRSPGLDSNISTKSAYSFTKPVENMHQGLPSHEDINVPPYLERQRRRKSAKETEELEIGGYQPSFSRGTISPSAPSPNKSTIVFNSDIRRTKKPATSEQKAKLMQELFGKKTENDSNDDDIFSPSRKSRTVKTAGFPWDENKTSSKNKGASPRQENTSTLINGGTAMSSQNEDKITGSDGTKLLPKRIRQPATTAFSSKPVVSAIDNIEDDIEEVML